MSAKLKKTTLSRQEWQDALRNPTPHRNKKKYFRKEKHKVARNSDSLFVYLG